MINRTLILLPTFVLPLLTGCVAEIDDPNEEAIDDHGLEIVGGTSTSIATHPWQISFQSASGSHFCGGSVLTDRWILTAQHCVDQSAAYSLSSPSTVRIGAGSTTLSGINGSGQIRAIEDIVPYPGYVDATQGKDVALLRLSSPLDLSDPEVEAIALATAADAAAGLTNPNVISTVTGWGTLSSGGSSPDTLQTVNVPLVSNAVADAAYSEAITADQIAAGDMVNGGEDSCQGDSGGPLTVAKGSGKILAGVVSWGEGCALAQYPGMYARVSSFESWISGYTSKSPTTLKTVTNLSGSTGSWTHNTVTVAAGKPVLNVHLSGGSGDGDLYVHFNATPTTSSYTCRPYSGGNNESCSIPNPSAGTWYISVRGYSAFSGATLRALTY